MGSEDSARYYRAAFDMSTRKIRIFPIDGDALSIFAGSEEKMAIKREPRKRKPKIGREVHRFDMGLKRSLPLASKPGRTLNENLKICPCVLFRFRSFLSVRRHLMDAVFSGL